MRSSLFQITQIGLLKRTQRQWDTLYARVSLLIEGVAELHQTKLNPIWVCHPHSIPRHALVEAIGEDAAN